MVKCEYPFCRQRALYVPVFEVPTIRTKGETDEWVETLKPTLLVSKPVCQIHRDGFDLTYWMPASDWRKLQDVARSRGLKINDLHLVEVIFKPLGWSPFRMLELERN